jgi:hypothetical protein
MDRRLVVLAEHYQVADHRGAFGGIVPASEVFMRPAFVLSCALCTCSFLACGGGDDGGGGAGGGSGTSPCVPAAEECYASGPTGPGHECLAKADNTGAATWQGRLTSIAVEAPKALGNAFIQEQVIDKGISLNQPSCFEEGDGTFSWLFDVDPVKKTMKTGGSLPITDPKSGGCFVSLPGASVPVEPIEVPVSIDADQKGFSATDVDVNVPIFRSAADLSNPIILPLHKVKIAAKFNDDTHNCVGKFNGDELDPGNSCRPDTKAIPPQRSWTPAGTLEGYITVEEADKVWLDQLKESLCVALAGIDWKGSDGYCKTSSKWAAGERPAADWCAATNDASCATKDSYLLKGSFAAAAFKINGDCP